MSLYNSLCDYLSRVKEDQGTALTLKKLDRAIDFEEKEGKLYFKMERHQAALGTVYTPGAGMSAYSRRIETYVFDPSSESIDVFECSEPVLDWDSVDCWGIAESYVENQSFSFEYDDNNESYKFSSSCCILQKHVFGLGRALEVVTAEAESMCFTVDCYPEIAQLSEGQQQRFEQECLEAHKEIMTRKVREAWEMREEDRDW